MKLQFLQDLVTRTDSKALPDRLLYTPYDELLVIDLPGDSFENRYHLDGKFFTPVTSRSYSMLYEYTASHMIHPEDKDGYIALMSPTSLSELTASGGIRDGVARFLALDGHWHPMEQFLLAGSAYGIPDGQIYLYLYDIQSIREREGGQRHREALPAERLLTRVPGLLSEEQFFSVAQGLIPSLEGSWCMIAVDIKHFKLFKDLNGQEKGEQLLLRFGELLTETAGAVQGVAGYRGQDDFCLLMPFDREKVDLLFSSLRREIDQLSSTTGFFPIFGICLIENPEDTALDLFNRAALTAEEIKDDLQCHIRVYDVEVHERNVEEFRLVSEFTEAMQNGEISFQLQPQCHVSTRKIIGSESLARWRRADGTFVPPTFFVPVLEKFGVVSTLDTFIWESVCQWLRSLIDRGIEPLPVSINVSRIDIFSRDIPAYLSELVERYRLPEDLLKVEITESAYVDDSETVQKAIAAFRARGFRVFMDDFGSGYSSLNMLRAIQVDAIKLDAQFLHFSLGEEKRGLNILDSVISMTKALGTPMIVEGVESEALVRYLSDMGCRYMQGFYFYRPMSPEQFEILLADPSRVDRRGMVVQISQQLQAREFLDSSVYNDAMLNNILGPVAFYALSGENVDIIRFNQQFMALVGLDVRQLKQRMEHIQKYIHPKDLDIFLFTLRKAKEDRINGAVSTFRVYRPDGSLFWIRIHSYYLRDEGDTSLFYTSAADVTEQQYLDVDLPGAYCRMIANDTADILYASPRFRLLTGFSPEEIADRFGNRFADMVHPEDLPDLLEAAHAVIPGNYQVFRPYRIRHRENGWITVAEEALLTDRYGELCWQSMFVEIDVSPK